MFIRATTKKEAKNIVNLFKKYDLIWNTEEKVGTKTWFSQFKSDTIYIISSSLKWKSILNVSINHASQRGNLFEVSYDELYEILKRRLS